MFIYYGIKGDKFCYRGKSNFYKKHIKDIERDSWIEFDLDDKWIDRFKIEEAKDYAREHRKFRIRVIKFKKSELKQIMIIKKTKQSFCLQILTTVNGQPKKLYSFTVTDGLLKLDMLF